MSAPAILPPEALIRDCVRRALDEDIGYGDLTTEATVPADARASGRIISRSAGVVAGLPVAAAVFRELDDRVCFRPLIHDGARIEPGDPIAEIEGPARAILGGERVSLNFLQQLSGVATATREIVDRIAHTEAKLLDTRKTIPGLRALQRYAVRCGSGTNHRFNLFDGILIKENHITASGGVSTALARARAIAGPFTPVEIEVETLEPLEEAIVHGADMVLLDNMTPDQMRQAVELAAGRVTLEASGDITIDTARAIAETGINFMSSGAITHSARALNLSLLLNG